MIIARRVYTELMKCYVKNVILRVKHVYWTLISVHRAIKILNSLIFKVKVVCSSVEMDFMLINRWELVNYVNSLVKLVYHKHDAYLVLILNNIIIKTTVMIFVPKVYMDQIYWHVNYVIQLVKHVKYMLHFAHHVI